MEPERPNWNGSDVSTEWTVKIWVEGYWVGTGRQENRRKIKEEINGCSEVGQRVGWSNRWGCRGYYGWGQMINGGKPWREQPKKDVSHLETGTSFQLILFVAALKQRRDKIVERTLNSCTKNTHHSWSLRSSEAPNSWMGFARLAATTWLIQNYSAMKKLERFAPLVP